MFKLPVTGTKQRAAATAVAAAAREKAEEEEKAEAAEERLRACQREEEAALEEAGDDVEEAEAKADVVDPLTTFHEDSSCAYPSMCASAEQQQDAEIKWGTTSSTTSSTKKRSAAEVAASSSAQRASQPLAVFVTGLDVNVTDAEIAAFFRAAGVVQNVYRVRSKGVGGGAFNGCVVVHFGSHAAATRACERSGDTLKKSEVTVTPSMRKLRRNNSTQEHAGGGAKFDDLHNTAHPFEIPLPEKTKKQKGATPVVWWSKSGTDKTPQRYEKP